MAEQPSPVAIAAIRLAQHILEARRARQAAEEAGSHTDTTRAPSTAAALAYANQGKQSELRRG